MPGGGVNAGNIKEILTVSGAGEIHFSGSDTIQSDMVYREGVSFTPEILGGDFTRSESSVEKIMQTIQATR